MDDVLRMNQIITWSIYGRVKHFAGRCADDVFVRQTREWVIMECHFTMILVKCLVSTIVAAIVMVLG